MKTKKYAPEVKARAVRMGQEHKAEYGSEWSTIESIAGKIGCAAQTLHRWVRQHERDFGLRSGLSSNEQQRIKDLEREVRELRKVNEILVWPARFSHRRSSTADSSRKGFYRPSLLHVAPSND